MKCKKFRNTALAVIAFVISSLHAESWHVEMDNDLLFSSDDAYTGGLNITYLGDELQSSQDGIYNTYSLAMKNLFSFILVDDFSGKNMSASMGIQEIVITPKNIEVTQPQYDDTPYVGLLNTHYSLFVWDETVFDQYRIQLGYVGKYSGAKELQKSIHILTDSQKANGWKNQLGETFVAGLGYLRGVRSYEYAFSESARFEWFNSFYGDLGNAYIGGGVGSVVRIGVNMPRNFDVSSGLFQNAPSKMLNLQSRSENLGYSLDIGTSLNGIGYLYLYDEGERQGYDFSTPRWSITSKIGLSLYAANIHCSLELFPMFTRDKTIQESSWGRFSFGWNY
jgi:hypothetical protein